MLYVPSDPKTGDPLYSYTVITVDGTHGPLSWLHDRMPALLPDLEAAEEWLKEGLGKKSQEGHSQQVLQTQDTQDSRDPVHT